MKKKAFLCIQCYTDHLSLCFKYKDKSVRYHLTDKNPLPMDFIKSIIRAYTLVIYDNNDSQIALLSAILNGANNTELFKIHNVASSLEDKDNIGGPSSQYSFNKNKDISYINLANIVNSDKKDLSLYAARMNVRNIKLPPTPAESLSIDKIDAYSDNYLSILEALNEELQDRINIRQDINDRFAIDVMNCSDSQIAEKFFKSKGDATKTIKKKSILKYKAPQSINFANSDLKDLLIDFEKREYPVYGDGKVFKELANNKKVTINGKVYTTGFGGLHSCEKAISVTPSKDEFLLEIDVTSYYPSIIINNGYYPESYGRHFLELYSSLYEDRLRFLRDQDETPAKIYKLIINNCFGKFSSVYSCLYDPSMLIHTTITGQLFLLMLIEILNTYNIEVISANTDALIVKGSNASRDTLDNVLKLWTGYNSLVITRQELRSIHIESVNSYIAFLASGKTKTKGSFAKNTIDNNASLAICKKAAINYLRDRTPIIDTVLQLDNKQRDFLGISTSKHGITCGDMELGTSARWYYSKQGRAMKCSKSGYNLPKADKVTPIQDLDMAQTDIDYQRYVSESYALLVKLGVDLESD